MQNLTAEQWLEYERNRLQKGYDENGKALRILDLKESIFVSKDEFEKANTMRIKMCDKEHHTGNRILDCTHEHWFFEKGKPVSCKLCKTTGQKNKRKMEQTEKSDTLIQRFNTAEEWEKFNNDEHIRKQGKHKHVIPRREEFTLDEAYSKAVELEVVDQACKIACQNV